MGLIKGYQWTNGGQGVIESIGTDRTFSSKYGAHGCPDKSANGMFTYAKSRGCAWGTMDTLPEVPGIALRFDGHVGVYIGGGYAVEERGFNYGCVKTKVSSRKWTHWYQLPFVDYGDAVFTGGSGVKADTPTSEYMLGTRTLKKGSKGTDVKAMQEFLLHLGYALPRYGADGEFGTETEVALKKFQTKAGVKQDGVYGSEPHRALMDAAADNDAGKETDQPDEPDQLDKPEQPDEPTQSDEPDTPTMAKRVCIVCGSGSVNIRKGNGAQYERITAVPNGTSFEWVATAENGWHAIVVNARVNWVSGKYGKLINILWRLASADRLFLIFEKQFAASMAIPVSLCRLKRKMYLIHQTSRHFLLDLPAHFNLTLVLHAYQLGVQQPHTPGFMIIVDECRDGHSAALGRVDPP